MVSLLMTAWLLMRQTAVRIRSTVAAGDAGTRRDRGIDCAHCHRRGTVRHAPPSTHAAAPAAPIAITSIAVSTGSAGVKAWICADPQLTSALDNA